MTFQDLDKIASIQSVFIPMLQIQCKRPEQIVIKNKVFKYFLLVSS